MRIDLKMTALALALIVGITACAEPYDKPAAMRRAQKAMTDRKFDEAITVLRDVIEHVPEDVEARFQLGLALGLSNLPLDARLELMQVIELDSTRADALEHLGMLAFGSGDRVEAIEMLERAIRMGARGIQLYDTLSYLHFQEGTVEKATQWMRNAIQANPEDPRFRMKLATLHHFVGAYDEARTVLEPLVEDYPNFLDGHLLLGKVYRQLGENDKALASLNKALAEMQGHVDFVHELGMVKLKTGDIDGAIEAFKEIVKRDPNKAEAHYGLGQAYLKKGDRERAKDSLETFRQMEQKEKDHKKLRNQFFESWQEGLDLEKAGDLEGAAAAYQQALSYKEDDFGTQLLVWLLLKKQGKTAAAAEVNRTLDAAMRQEGREFKEVASTLAARVVKKGYDEKAVDLYRILLDLHPEERVLRYQLIKAYSRLGMEKERQEQFAIFRDGSSLAEPEGK